MKVGVVGASGAVGTVLIEILAQRKFPVQELRAYASMRSRGKAVGAEKLQAQCQVLAKGCFDGLDVVFFDASDAISKEWVPEAARAGAWVVDNSATYRMDPQVPLVVPEINGNLINTKSKVIAGPNCSTVQLVQALWPLEQKYGLSRVVVSTYQSVSGAGSAAMGVLRQELESSLGKGMDPYAQITRGHRGGEAVFAHPIAFNCIPQIGGFSSGNGDGEWSSEERKIMEETRKILGLPALKIAATAARVPTLIGHCESVSAELSADFASLSEVRQAIAAQPGVIVRDEPQKSLYPMPIHGENLSEGVLPAAGSDAVMVGRIRRDPSVKSGVLFWIAADNLRKGAALNAVQIAERIFGSF